MGSFITLEKDFIESDTFSKLNNGAKALYLHAMANADQYGFISDIFNFTTKRGFSATDLNNLREYGFLIVFEDDAALIAHYFANTTQEILLDPNRKEDYDKVSFDPKKVFKPFDTKLKKRRAATEFVAPTLDEVKAYAASRNSPISPLKFYTYYTTPDSEGKRWVDSNGKPVKDWKRKFVTWEKRHAMEGAANGRGNYVNTQKRTERDSQGVSRRYNLGPTYHGTTEGR